MHFTLAEIVGFWSDQEIQESYSIGYPAWIAFIAGTVIACGIILALYRSRPKDGLIVFCSVMICLIVYLGLVQNLSSSLCINAPLDVVARGVLRIPFWLGSNWQGIVIFIGSFVAANIAGRLCSVFPLTTLWINASLLAFFVMVLLASYLFVCLRGAG